MAVSVLGLCLNTAIVLAVHAGHVFPGATLPFGMAKAVADVSGDSHGGFALDDSSITGFSHMHDGGTGGGASLGNFPLFVCAGCPNNELNGCKFSKADRAIDYIEGSPSAHPHCFAVQFNSGIKTELTTTNHTALYRFTFLIRSTAASNQPEERACDAEPLSPLLIAELTDLSESILDGTASVNPGTGRMTGSGTFQPSFGMDSCRLHFCADFRGAAIKETGVVSMAVVAAEIISATSAA
jgi:hypothetical protein